MKRRSFLKSIAHVASIVAPASILFPTEDVSMFDHMIEDLNYDPHDLAPNLPHTAEEKALFERYMAGRWRPLGPIQHNP